MEVPVQIDFQGCEPQPALRDRIATCLEKLETRFGRITAARVVIKGPGGHHRTGGLYEVGIHLSLPEGRAVDVERTPTPDERFGQPLFAINDAFRRARRQLEDEVRKLDRRVKDHAPVPTATVARLDPSGEFGFLETADGGQIYFHRNSVIDHAFPRLKEGSRGTFVEEAGDEGPQASTVRLMGKHSLRI